MGIFEKLQYVLSGQLLVVRYLVDSHLITADLPALAAGQVPEVEYSHSLIRWQEDPHLCAQEFEYLKS